MTIHVFGAALAFLGFTASLLIGMFVNNPYETVLWRSMGIMIIFYVLGCMFSAIGFKVIQENFEAEIEDPQTESDEQADDTRSAGDEVATELPDIEVQEQTS